MDDDMGAVLDNPVNACDPDIAKLASLSSMDYDKVREVKAKELKVRVGTLDKVVAAARVSVAEEESEEVVEVLSPWPESVNGDALLTEIEKNLTRHTVMQSGCSTAVAIWSLGSFCLDSFRLFPKLQVKSPEKRCGKSTLMECLEGVTCSPLPTSNISASALFRCIEAWRPTLLIDEADTFAKDNDELNGIINAGHTKRQATVIRTVKVNDEHTPRKFSVWSAQVISGIKSQRDTLEDRSVTISMRRKKPGESVSKIPVRYFDNNQTLRRKCLRWAADNARALELSEVEAPPCGNDRAQDNWTPLFAIAALVGGNWLQKVLKAYQSIETTEEDDTAAIMLLSDIREIFRERNVDEMHSEELVAKLIMKDNRPWAEWKRGFPMTKNSVAHILKPFDIRSKQLKIAGINRNGYRLEEFTDAFERYLAQDPPSQNSTTLQPSAGAGSSDFQNSTEVQAVEFQNDRKPSAGAGCREVEFQKGGVREVCLRCGGEGCVYCRIAAH